jgi:hypothetical protein
MTPECAKHVATFPAVLIEVLVSREIGDVPPSTKMDGLRVYQDLATHLAFTDSGR